MCMCVSVCLLCGEIGEVGKPQNPLDIQEKDDFITLLNRTGFSKFHDCSLKF